MLICSTAVHIHETNMKMTDEEEKKKIYIFFTIIVD